MYQLLLDACHEQRQHLSINQAVEQIIDDVFEQLKTCQFDLNTKPSHLIN
jgi:hypothetical protein